MEERAPMMRKEAAKKEAEEEAAKKETEEERWVPLFPALYAA